MSRGQRQLRALVLFGALVTTLLLVFYPRVPDTMGLALLVDNAAPWFGVAVPVLLLMALLSRSRSAIVFVLVPAIAWLVGFGAAIIPLVLDRPGSNSKFLDRQQPEHQSRIRIGRRIGTGTSQHG